MIILVLLYYCKYIYSGGRGAMPKFYCGATSAVLLLHCIMIEGLSAVLYNIHHAVRFLGTAVLHL